MSPPCSLRISGLGWVTPLGSGVKTVWDKLCAGEKPTVETIASPLHSRSYPVYRVPAEATAKGPPHPRLRRASAISRFAAVAGLAALEDAGLNLDSSKAERTALIFAISNGGVIYTKRFYHEVVETGAKAASPLLFPETVFNAPASHLAAILGVTGASYTLVGDGAVGLLAVKMAEDLMEHEGIDRCLIVGAEEADWLLCDAYHHWRLFGRKQGRVLSEGAGAVLLEKDSRPTSGAILIDQIAAGCNYGRRSEAAACLTEVLRPFRLTADDLVIQSANGTFIDSLEAIALTEQEPEIKTYAPKMSLGESVGAGALWQMICGAQALSTQNVPGSESHSPARSVILACGLNQQIAAVSLTRS